MTYPYIPTRWLITTPDLADSPDVFPLLPGQMFVTGKGPKFPAATVQEAVSGREIASQLATVPRWSFQVKYEFLRDRPPSQSDLQRLQGFFLKRLGRWGRFAYWDPSDHDVSESVIGVGDGSNKTFQFNRTVALGTPHAFAEPVYMLSGTPVVSIAGTPTTDFTVGAFGALTFGSAPASGASITWTGQFMFLCRFDTDSLTAAQMTADLWSMDGLNFVSVKP